MISFDPNSPLNISEIWVKQFPLVHKLLRVGTRHTTTGLLINTIKKEYFNLEENWSAL